MTWLTVSFVISAKWITAPPKEMQNRHLQNRGFHNERKVFRLRIERHLSFTFERAKIEPSAFGMLPKSRISKSHTGHITTPAARAGILALEGFDLMFHRCYFQNCRSLENGIEALVILTDADEHGTFPSHVHSS